MNPRRTDLNISVTIRFSVVVFMMGTVLFSLTDGTRNPLFPLSPELMLATQVVAFMVSLRFIRIPTTGLCSVGLVLWILIFALSTISTSWATFPLLSLERTLLVFLPSIFLFLLVINDSNPTETFWKVSQGLVVFGTLLSMIGVILYIFGQPISTESGLMQVINIGGLRLQQSLIGTPPLLRISSLAGNPNSLASWLMITLNLTVVLRLVHRISRFRFVLLSCLQTIALILTFSRAGIGTAVITMGALYILSARTRKRQALRIIVTVLALLASILILSYLAQMFPALRARLAIGFNERDFAWSLLWNVFVNSPLGGVGFGISYETVLEDAGLTIGAHNLFLGLLSELGIIGFLLFMMLWLLGFLGSYRAIKNIKKSREHTRYDEVIIANYIISLLMGLLIHQCFEFGLLRYGFFTLYWTYLVSMSLNPAFAGIKHEAEELCSGLSNHSYG